MISTLMVVAVFLFYDLLNIVLSEDCPYEIHHDGLIIVSKIHYSSGAISVLCEGFYQGTRVIIKFMSETYQYTEEAIARELNVTRIMSESNLLGFPTLYMSGRLNFLEPVLTYMVISYLGPTLYDSLYDYSFSLNYMLDIIIQLIDRLEALWYHGFIHRDLKLSNIAFGSTKEDEDVIYLIDFGESTSYPGYGLAGTPAYGPARILEWTLPIDELESLGYIFIFILHKDLPWGISDGEHKDLTDIKKSISIDNLCMVQLYPDNEIGNAACKAYFTFIRNCQQNSEGNEIITSSTASTNSSTSIDSIYSEVMTTGKSHSKFDEIFTFHDRELNPDYESLRVILRSFYEGMYYDNNNGDSVLSDQKIIDQTSLHVFHDL